MQDAPKVLALVGGRPFLEILIEHFLSQGFNRIILSVGYLKEKIREHFINHRFSEAARIEFSEEDIPLGTGGAIKNLRHLIGSDHFLVVNGDSFCPADLFSFYESHVKNDALISLVLSEIEDGSDCGSVEIGKDGKVLSFREKDHSLEEKNKLVSAGIYFMKKEIFDLMPEEDSFSIEKDFFPKVLENCHGFVTKEKFIDIGTPGRYEKAQKMFSSPNALDLKR
ncbi:MAG: sugar phosphate nucleotidyltransferase [Candidatus Wolfebacteria bacterium]|nr:sugar phosphate nucleotidyltransferase [Candidatus Wolfebacteria bacterium]